MNSKKLKTIWESVFVDSNKSKFYSMEVDKTIANYKVTKSKLQIDLTNIEYYNETVFNENISNIIHKIIISNALDYENNINVFEIKFEGKILNKAAI